MASAIISKKRKFVADGVFSAELNEFFTRELAAEGYSGCLVRVNHVRTEIIIRATHTQEVLGDKGRRLRELTSLVRQRFRFPEGSLELYAEKVANRGLHAVAQCESLRNKLLGGLPVRRAAYGVLRYVMESGAKGCEVVISGKVRGARAKAMKFKDGFMIHTGQPAKDFVDEAIRHVLMKQGVLGLRVKIMHGWDPEGRSGRPFPLRSPSLSRRMMSLLRPLCPSRATSLWLPLLLPSPLRRFSRKRLPHTLRRLTQPPFK